VVLGGTKKIEAFFFGNYGIVCVVVMVEKGGAVVIR